MQGFINLASFGVEATDALPAGTTSPPSQADIAARLIVRFRELVALDIEGSPSLEGVFGAIVECIVTGRHIRQIQGEIVDLLNQITLSFIDGASDQVTTSGSEAEEGEDGDEGNGPEFPSEAATNTELFYLEAERRLTDEDQKCMWCLYDVPAGEVATFLPCSHWFHPPCIRAWLRFNGHCPWCRQTINERIYKARYARVELDGRVIEASRRAEERRDAAVAAMQEAMSSAETDEERLRIQVEYQARVRRQIEEYRDELLYEDIIIPPWPLISAAITRGIPQPPREITSAHGRPRSQEEEEKQRRGHSAPGRTSGRPEWGSGTKREREEADEQGRPPKAAKGLHEGTAEHDEEIGEHGGATGEHDGEMSEHDSATGEHGCEGATGGRNSNNGSCSSRETPTRTNRNTPNERAHLGSRVSNSIRRVRDSAMARTQSIRRMVRSIRDRPRRTRTRRNPDQ
ncbi:hypothetical protein N7468_005455 [Penicillium chermesinum]|uniref:RING-type E3 ubiquitin transferase n=1 Tax=Penicillium chermesinum TaxID=63820 RepID=A0A9W9NZA2_9EURO|nr:uncharacterized protein N7468_005455 [Penicillium chermesinum]KAJ5232499.1 hypothetical protein N7468_005455 [Penicillium chermesinum]